MFHKASTIEFQEGTVLVVTFQTGEKKRFDVSSLFEKYPQMKALEDRNLFLSGKMIGCYGIIWNDDIDLETETIYHDGITISVEKTPPNCDVGNALLKARSYLGISQKDLSSLSGIDQGDISKIERGISNPSINTLKRIASALGATLEITFEMKNTD